MLDPLIDFVRDAAPVLAPWAKPVVIVGLFAVAWLVSRVSGAVAGRLLEWHDKRQTDTEGDLTAKITEAKRRETSVGVIRTGIAYVAFAAAIVLSVAQLAGGVDRLTAIAGASFVLILVGFAAQRVLTDILAGLMMFLERWYSVGDTIFIPGHELQGVVEDVSLRRTKLRSLDGEAIHVHNSQIAAVRVLPRGVKELAVELFVSDRLRAERLVMAVSGILPEGPTTFIRRPWIDQVEDLADSLVRIRLLATVAPGREWLVNGFFCDLLKERAGAGLIVHGPVVLSVDEGAVRSFARATAETRWSGRVATAER
jgi:moderate conductance mechanosensitive channel